LDYDKLVTIPKLRYDLLDRQHEIQYITAAHKIERQYSTAWPNIQKRSLSTSQGIFRKLNSFEKN